tara:strand:+ start:96 stop:326 length:231 start_codon:yes stop_codon:yes gene_type:complete
MKHATPHQPETDHMTDTLTVTQKSNYGQTVFYPACDLARLFANIANTTTLTNRALRQIEDHGFKVEIESPTTKGWR